MAEVFSFACSVCENEYIIGVFALAWIRIFLMIATLQHLLLFLVLIHVERSDVHGISEERCFFHQATLNSAERVFRPIWETSPSYILVWSSMLQLRKRRFFSSVSRSVGTKLSWRRSRTLEIDTSWSGDQEPAYVHPSTHFSNPRCLPIPPILFLSLFNSINDPFFEALVRGDFFSHLSACSTLITSCELDSRLFKKSSSKTLMCLYQRLLRYLLLRKGKCTMQFLLYIEINRIFQLYCVTSRDIVE